MKVKPTFWYEELKNSLFAFVVYLTTFSGFEKDLPKIICINNMLTQEKIIAQLHKSQNKNFAKLTDLWGPWAVII
jgi:hypothetical protein